MRQLLGCAIISFFISVSTFGQTTDVGVWKNVTPPNVPLGGMGGNNCDYGTLAIALAKPSIVYLGTCQHGVMKSTDSGETWVHINTGRNGAILDGTRQWTMVVDPTDSNIVYTNSGYGGDPNNGAWKSTNGGVDWDRIWPSADPSQANIVWQNFVAQINMDPTDHNHLVMSWHGSCAAPYTPVCYAESKNAGSTWIIRNGDTRWLPSEAQTVYAADGQHWLFANHADGLWRSSDAGVTWFLIDKDGAGHWPSTLYRSPLNGVYYIGSDQGLYRSADFITWERLGIGWLTNGVAGDGTTLFIGNCGALTPWCKVPPDPWAPAVYQTSPETNGRTFTPAPWPIPAGMWTQGPGGDFEYDSVNHYLFSSNGTAGLWRVRTSVGVTVPKPPIKCQQPVLVDGVQKLLDKDPSYCDGAK